MRFLANLSIVVMLPLAAAGVAHADTASVACGYSNGLQINMPTGAVGLTVAGGPVQAVLNAVGETRTHSFINHGNGWITHSGMLTPSSYGSGGTNGSDASMDLPLSPSQTQNGYPGSSQINMGALYDYYYAGGSGPSGSGASATVGNVQAFYYQRGSIDGNGNDRGNLVQSWLWNSSSYAWVGNDGIGGQGNGGYYRVGFAGTPYKQYSLYQYMNIENVPTGGSSYNNGDVCSTTLAAAQYLALGAPAISPSTYTSAQISSGMNAEWWAVYGQCMNSSAGWFDIFGIVTYIYLAANGDSQTGASCCNDNGSWTCFPVGHSWCTFNHENSNKAHLCAKAANQIANCFTSGNTGACYSNGSPTVNLSNLNNSNQDEADVTATWQQVILNGTQAHSISPDAIGGWSGHSWGQAPPNPVWSWDGNNQVTWNAAGNTYGCWY